MKLLDVFASAPVVQSVETVDVSIEQADKEYQALAHKVGLTIPKPPVIPGATLRNILAEAGISIYPMKSVESYMNKITPRGKIWQWHPLRERDYTRVCRMERFEWYPGGTRSATFSRETYAHRVPLAALISVDKIESTGCSPAFFVTDYATPTPPDPFLMVCIPHEGNIQINHLPQDLVNPETCFVIERWDEPGFRS